MFGKTSLFFFVACVALQINVNYAKTVSIKAQPLTHVIKPFDILDDGEELLDKLEAKLQPIVDSGLKSLENDLENFKAISGIIKESGDFTINNMETELIAGLDAIKQKAEDNGLNITICLGANEDELLGLGNKARELADTCTEKTYNNEVQDNNDSKDEINDFFGIVAMLRKTLRRCTTDECRADIVDSVKNTYFDSIGIWIDAEVILQLMNTSLNESIYSSCYVEASFEVYNGNDVLNAIEECVNDLSK